MHLFPSVLLFISFYISTTVAQFLPQPAWWFPDRVTLANGVGHNGTPRMPVSYVNDTLWKYNLSQPFTITARLNATDRAFWRSAISIESPAAASALFRISLPPNSMNINIAWIRNAHTRGGSINTGTVAPGPGVEFHFALVKDDRNIMTIYINGAFRESHALTNEIFDPRDKQIVLGRTKLDGYQWRGSIRDVALYRLALSNDEVLEDMSID